MYAFLVDISNYVLTAKIFNFTFHIKYSAKTTQGKIYMQADKNYTSNLRNDHMY